MNQKWYFVLTAFFFIDKVNSCYLELNKVEN